MNLSINLGNQESALAILNQIKENDYVPFDVKITNSHITSLNGLSGQKIFRKDTLYINSRTLWEIMQELGGAGSHNYHGLTPNDIFIGLRSLNKPSAVIRVKNNRYAIISVELSHFNEPLMIVIETGAELRGKIHANVNKIVTIYPKSDFDEYIKKIDEKEIVYQK